MLALVRDPVFHLPEQSILCGWKVTAEGGGVLLTGHDGLESQKLGWFRGIGAKQIDVR